MTLDLSKDVLFLGAGTGSSPVFYYRCLLPATALGCSYASFVGDWPKVRWATGLLQDREGGPPVSKVPALQNYKIVVMQQPRTQGWLDLIKALVNHGITVLVECDDYLHGIAGKKDHDYREFFKAKHLARYERCFRAASGMIVSTPYIAEQYVKFNKNMHVCFNGLDLGRYAIKRPARKTVNIGWAGATGHVEAVKAWLQSVANVMGRHDNTTFVTIGMNFADSFRQHFGTRALSIPFASIEQYPGAMTMFDIALAPAGKGGWYLGKSDLRFLEAGALGTPIIADPTVYPFIRDRETGFHATTAPQMEGILEELIVNEELRTSVGAAAKHYVETERAIQVTAQQWRAVFEEVMA